MVGGMIYPSYSEAFESLVPATSLLLMGSIHIGLKASYVMQSVWVLKKHSLSILTFSFQFLLSVWVFVNMIYGLQLILEQILVCIRVLGLQIICHWIGILHIISFLCEETKPETRNQKKPSKYHDYIRLYVKEPNEVFIYLFCIM